MRRKNFFNRRSIEVRRKTVGKKGKSGTAQVYANSLKNAFATYSGKELNQNSAIDFVQTLMGGAAPVMNPAGNNNDMAGRLLSGAIGSQEQGSGPSDNSDLLGSLISGMMGGQIGAQNSSSAESPAADLLSGLLGGGSQAGDGKFDLSDAMQIGMGYLQANQSGCSDLEALAGAVMNRTQMGQKEQRAPSGTIVPQTLLSALSQFSK